MALVKVCAECGAEFTGRSSSVTCSAECRKARRLRQIREGRKVREAGGSVEYSVARVNEASQKAVLMYVSAGYPLQAAAARAEVPIGTATSWAQNDEAFKDAYNQAREEAHADAVGGFNKARKFDGRLQLEYLKRRHPEDWREKTDVKVEGGDAPVQVEYNSEQIRVFLDEAVRRRALIAREEEVGDAS